MEYSLLNRINDIKDLKQLQEQDLPTLCEQIRSFMIENVLETGGHLASSLGAVELIVAIHYVFDSPQDKIIFDVGHQAYAHKILTGRRDDFVSLRQEGGISGFPKREESVHDAFNTGHASTAVSAALGFARAKKLCNEKGVAVALVGDGAMTGGLSFEAMDDAGNDKLPLIIVLNDNEMSIAKNVGGLTHSFASMRTGRVYNAFKRAVVHTLETSKFGKWLSKHLERTKNRIKHFLIPHLPFEDLGFTYIGPIDGHDIKKLIRYLKRVRDMNKPVVLHTLTKKGKGYLPAETDPERFHGISPHAASAAKDDTCHIKTCSEVFGETLIDLGEKNPSIVAITAAMPSGTGLTPFSKRFPERFYDVGIAEEHAVTMAAGLAAGGLRPVLALYSSFLQRAYDQLLHDVCLQNLPVVIGVDRAGFVGEDGETHQGVYDAAFLLTMPNLAVYNPGSEQELSAMIRMALERKEPAAIRYNRGSLPNKEMLEALQFGKWETIRPLQTVTIFASGPLLSVAEMIAEEKKTGLINMRFSKPIDQEILDACREKRVKILVLEESIPAVSKEIALYCCENIVRTIAVTNHPVAQGTIQQQRDRYGMNLDGIRALVTELEEM